MNIFIGSSSRVERKEYLELANSISKELSNYYDLICGGLETSMMKIIYDNFKEKGKNITIVTLELYNEDLSSIENKYLMNTTLDRLNKIYELSDLFLILPGGSGTISEAFGILEELRTKKDHKKLYIYNYNGYYDFIKDILDRSIDIGFNSKDIYDYIEFIDDIKVLKK